MPGWPARGRNQRPREAKRNEPPKEKKSAPDAPVKPTSRTICSDVCTDQNNKNDNFEQAARQTGADRRKPPSCCGTGRLSCDGAIVDDCNRKVSNAYASEQAGARTNRVLSRLRNDLVEQRCVTLCIENIGLALAKDVICEAKALELRDSLLRDDFQRYAEEFAALIEQKRAEDLAQQKRQRRREQRRV